MTVRELIEELKRVADNGDGDTEVMSAGDDIVGALVKVYPDGGRLVILS